jgi:KDO2-lipid IV(A) lauroyltransferase
MVERRPGSWVESTFWRTVLVQGGRRAPDVLLRAVPPLAGCLFWAALPAARAGAGRSLRRVLGPRGAWRERRDVLATFVAYGQSLAEGVAAFGPRAERVRFEIEAPDFFYELARGGRGCVFVTAHTSGFEVAGAGLGRALKLPVVMAMRAEANAEARAMHDAERERAGLEVVHVGDDPLASLTLAGQVRRGKAVGLQLDRMPPGARGVDVTLFGAPARLPLGPFALARATGAPLVAVWTRRTGFLRVRIRAQGPWQLSRRAGAGEIAAVAADVASSFEAWVGQAPHHWFDWGKGVDGWSMPPSPRAALEHGSPAPLIESAELPFRRAARARCAWAAGLRTDALRFDPIAPSRARCARAGGRPGERRPLHTTRTRERERARRPTTAPCGGHGRAQTTAPCGGHGRAG